MNYPIGSVWRKWDLQVHTPSSLVHHYREAGSDGWERFLDDLEKLPPEFKVLGITDYIFIDGYKRLLEEKRTRKRLKNIDLILPAIELRLDQFGGSGGHLKRVNFHVIFADEVDPNVIQSQFINALWSTYQLEPAYEKAAKKWGALPTRESLDELGRMIIGSVPQAKRSNFSAPIIEGFNNINFKLDSITQALKKPYFENQYILAVGKTEWSALNWNDNSVASKKHLLNSANIVLTSAETVEAYHNSRAQLETQQVNHHLLDCSDAHYYSVSQEKDRIGNCFTWIKADTTFEGLRHALFEFEDRVFIGEEPDKLRTVRSNPTKFIEKVHIEKTPGSSFSETWFNESIPLNSDLVAIIGNKGSGKSALADIIGLLGNTKNHASFSFLQPNRFRDPKNNKARYFTATLTWESGELATKNLSDPVNPQDVEMLTYIPQNFLETICNETSTTGETEFDRELKKVIFSHVADPDRLGTKSLDELLNYKTTETFQAIKISKSELSLINAQIAHLEDKGVPLYRQTLENQLRVREAALQAHGLLKPAELKKPENDPEKQIQLANLTRQIDVANATRLHLLSKQQATSDRQKTLARLIITADRLIERCDNFARQADNFRKECEADLNVLGITYDSIARVTLQKKPIVEKRAGLAVEKNSVDALLNPNKPQSFPRMIKSIDDDIRKLQEQFDEPNKQYITYSMELQQWEEKRAEIIGDMNSVGSVEYYRQSIKELDELPIILEAAYSSRNDKSLEIFTQISKLANDYRELYRSVEEFVGTHPLAKDKLQLNFEVSIINTEFEGRFLDQINHSASGSFSGLREGRELLQSMLEKYNFNEGTHIIAFLTEVANHLIFDRRQAEERRLNVADQLKKGYTVTELYDYIFSLDYLKPRYTLKLSDKELSQLSPGEKGSLLLIFYLLVDQNDSPLVIDQPEENLDSQTIFNLLVPCVKEAKQRRQTIIVTHSPNLAVVCDAEQVIHAHHDKVNRNTVTYTCGAIENPLINRKLLDVLEGTRPAFDNRAEKYLPD